MLQRPLLDHSSFGVFYTGHNNKTIGVYLLNFGIHFMHFQPCDYTVNNINVFCISMLAKASFSCNDGNTPAKLVDYHLPDLFVMRRDDGNGNIFFNAFYNKVQRTGGREISDHGIKGNVDTQEFGCR